jgi:hypothetical protein
LGGHPNLFPILGGGILIIVALLIPGGLVDAIGRASALAKRGFGVLVRSVKPTDASA